MFSRGTDESKRAGRKPQAVARQHQHGVSLVDHTAAISFQLETFGGGNLITLKSSGLQAQGGGGRGKVGGFSEASRLRLLKLFASIDKGALKALPLFVTLTYPGDFPLDRRAYKRDLDVFGKSLRRVVPKVAIIWRLEFQKRGAPHYHLILFNMPDLNAGDRLTRFRGWLSKRWFEIVGSGDQRHLRAGTQAVYVDNMRAVWTYVSKYCAKVEPQDGQIDLVSQMLQTAGRAWGVIGKDNLAIRREVVELDRQQFIKVRRVSDRYLSRRLGKKRQARANDIGGFVFLSEKTVAALVDWVKDEKAQAVSATQDTRESK